MAGLDKMYDTLGSIQKYIDKCIRQLLDDSMNIYQEINWVQASLLFEQVVVPCEAYRMEWLYKLAEAIVKKAEKSQNRGIYQRLEGMYNERTLDLSSVDMDNLPDNTEIRDYTDTITSIKTWMEHFKNK